MKADPPAAASINEGPQESRRPPAQATILTDIGRTHTLFHDPGNEPYAIVSHAGHLETYPINSSDYRDCLSREFYRQTGKGANRNALMDATSTLSAIAKFDGPCRPVFLRVGETSQGIVIDDGADDWGAWEITGSGWREAFEHPLCFRRSGKPRPLPRPGKARANIDLLWSYVNVDPDDRILVLAWLLAALRPRGPYPILLLIGEQGCGKSQTSRVLKSLTDPSDVPLRAPPKDEKDLLVAALSSWVLALDNLSGASPEMSDALCRLSTGGGFSARRLYTDSDEVLVAVQRPVILNGIDDLASRPDLAQRCLHLSVPVLKAPGDEDTLNRGFAEDAPAIFSALLDGVAMALRDVGEVRPARLPRMADFALWAGAGIQAFGYTPEAFFEAYAENQAQAIEVGLESSSFARAVLDFMKIRPTWRGGAFELLHQLRESAGDAARSGGWPRSPKGLFSVLRRLAPSLRHAGIEYERSRSSERNLLELRPCIKGRQPPQAPLLHPADGAMEVMEANQP